MKITSFWYKDGDGQTFHVKNKIDIFLNVLNGRHEFNTLKNLVIKKEWLDVSNEKILPSHQFVLNMQYAYIREIPKLLKGCGWLNKLAIHKTSDFLIILFRSDDMYYERMGYIIWRLIQISSEWISTDLEGRKHLLHVERLNYFAQEHREDRIRELTHGWNFIENEYATDIGIQRSIDWIVTYLASHGAEFDYNEIGRLGMQQFHPDQWYPVGRGGLWDAIHAGKG